MQEGDPKRRSGLEDAAGSFAEADVSLSDAAEAALDASFVSNDWSTSTQGEDFIGIMEATDDELASLDALREQHNQLVLDTFGG